MSDWHSLPVPACSLAESPRFAHGQWVWLDIHARMLFATAHSELPSLERTQVYSHAMPDEIACILPSTQSNLWFGLGRQGLWMYSGLLSGSGHEPEHTGVGWTLIQTPLYDPSTHRYNDGRADANGRIWISSLVDARQPASAALYKLDPKGAAIPMVDGLIVGNGLGFSPDGQFLWLADTRHRRIWRHTLDAGTGQLGQAQLVHEYTQGTERPDGACFTTDGSYWVAVVDGYRVDRFNAEGFLQDSIELPLAKPTMPCFGGPQGSTLLVCSARGDATHPNRPGFENASLIACHTGYTGLTEAMVHPEHYRV